MSLPALLAFGLGTGLAGVALDRLEHKAAADIAFRLEGPRKEVRVDVQPHLASGGLWKATIAASHFSLNELPFFAEPQYGSGGKLEELKLDLRDFNLCGLEVQELSATIPNCRFDLGKAAKGEIRLNRTGDGQGRVKIGEEALAKWIVKKIHEIKRCTVKVDRDVIWVEGYGEFLIVKSTFTVIAKIKAVDGVKLSLDQAKIYFDWQRATPLAAKALLDVMNPVVDLSKDLRLYDAVSVEKIELRGGSVVASGRTRIPHRPAENTGR